MGKNVITRNFMSKNNIICSIYFINKNTKKYETYRINYIKLHNIYLQRIFFIIKIQFSEKFFREIKNNY